MEAIITFGFAFEIPAIFLVLCIENIVGIVKAKKEKVTVKKSLIIKSIIFGVNFIWIVFFYILIVYSLSRGSCC